MRKEKYSFTVHWSQEDDAFLALCPSFPGLSAFGDTKEKALQEAEVALQLFVEEYEEAGEALPDPQTLQDFSGQMSLRMPSSLHAQLAARAEVEDVSMNQLVNTYIAQGLRGDQFESEALREVHRLTQTFHGMRQAAYEIATVFTSSSAVADYDGGPEPHPSGVQDPALRMIYAQSRAATE